MRQTISAFVIAAGLLGFGAAAQAAPVPAATTLHGLASDSLALQVQMRPRERMMMRDRMERRMMRRRMERRMMRREMRRRY